MLEIERKLWRSPIPTILLKACYLEQVVGECAQLGFRPHDPCGHPVPIYNHPQSKKNLFLGFKGIFCGLVCVHCLFCCPSALQTACLCLLYCTHLPHNIFTHTDEIPVEPSLQSSLACLSLHSCDRFFKPLIIIVTLCKSHSSMSSSVLYWEAQKSSQHSTCVSPALSRGPRALPTTCWQRS